MTDLLSPLVGLSISLLSGDVSDGVRHVGLEPIPIVIVPIGSLAPFWKFPTSQPDAKPWAKRYRVQEGNARRV